MSTQYHIGTSSIHGVGIIADRYFPPYFDIDLIISESNGTHQITEKFGKYINHSYTPNAYLQYKRGGWYACAYAHGIQPGQEITVDYRCSPLYISRPEPWYV